MSYGKKFAMVVAFIVVSAVSASADFVEYSHMNGVPTASILASGKAKGKFGWSGYTLIQKNWQEAMIGPTFAPAKWVEVSINAGFETGGKRFYESLWLGKGPVSVLGLYEHGFSGSWHKVTAEVTVRKGLTIGYHDQAFLGRGPRFSYTRGKIMAWASVLIKDGGVHPVVSLRVSK